MPLQGDFTCEDDKRKLVSVVLGLWALVDADTSDETTADRIHEMVQRNIGRVFPPSLFGNLLQTYDDMLDAYSAMPGGEFATVQLGIGQLLSYPIIAHGGCCCG